MKTAREARHPLLPTAWAAALCVGCAGEPAAPAPPATSLFEVPTEQSQDASFYALPFPNDIRVDAAGVVDLSAWPRMNDLIERWAGIISSEQRGFGVNGPAFFRLSGELAIDSLPTSAAASLLDDSAIYLVDVDVDSPQRGQRVPVRWRFEREANQTIGANWLAIMPFPGFTLRDETTYAAVLTRRAHASDGRALAPATDFVAIAASQPASTSELRAAQLTYEPLFSWLDESGGDERADIVSAAVFTTQDCTSLMGKLQSVATSLPTPEVSEVSDSELTGPDVKDPEKSKTWPATFRLYEGKYEAPNFIAGEAPHYEPSAGGFVELGDDAMPIVQRMEPMRFALAIPQGDAPKSGWPLVLYAHGTTGNYRTFIRSGVAAELTTRGLAVVGIDQVLHGPRSDGTSTQLTFFNLENPYSARDSMLQGAVDNVSLMRAMLSLEGEQIDLEIANAFDADKVLFMGHSQGGLTGMPFVAHESNLKGAVLSGSYAVRSVAFTNLREAQGAAMLRIVLNDPEVDEFHPALAMMQMWTDRSDSACHASLLRKRTGGSSMTNVFLSEGFDDSISSQEGIEALATALGLDQVEPMLSPVEGLTLRGSEALQPPVRDNRSGSTGVLLQYRATIARDGHYVIFHNPAALRQYPEFLRTVAYEGMGTVVAP